MWIKQLICSGEHAPQSPVLVHSFLAGGALGFAGDLDEATAVPGKAIALRPEASSLARYRTQHPWEIDPAYLTLRARTLDVGLRSIGFPDE